MPLMKRLLIFRRVFFLLIYLESPRLSVYLAFIQLAVVVGSVNGPAKIFLFSAQRTLRILKTSLWIERVVTGEHSKRRVVVRSHFDAARHNLKYAEFQVKGNQLKFDIHCLSYSLCKYLRNHLLRVLALA